MKKTCWCFTEKSCSWWSHGSRSPAQFTRSPWTVGRVAFSSVRQLQLLVWVNNLVENSQVSNLDMNDLCFHPGILSPFWSILLWVALGVSTALLPVLPMQWGIVFFFISFLLRAIYTMGLAPALLLLGTINVSKYCFQPQICRPSGSLH